MASRVDRVMSKLYSVEYGLMENERKEVYERNKKVRESFESMPEYTEALSQIKKIGMDKRDLDTHIDSQLSRPKPKGIAKALIDQGYQLDQPSRLRYAPAGYGSGDSKESVLLATALETTAKKVWNDLHSPLHLFLNAVDRVKTRADLDKAVMRLVDDLR